MRYKRKTLRPNDFRDFLSIISFIGFVAIFLKFSFNFDWLSNALDSIFLILAGAGLLVVGKVLSIDSLLKDGIQKNETTQLLSLIVGFSSLLIGVILLIGLSIPVRFLGYVGIVAIFPAIFILLDYLVKNTQVTR